MRGDQPEKLRLRYDDLKAINPRIVCAHLSAYGCDGSRRGWPGYDFLVQAECGFLSVTGEPDSPPARFGLSMVDYMTGMTPAFALMCGLHAARTTGVGRDVEVSLYDVAIHQLSYPATWYLNEGLVTTRLPRSASPISCPRSSTAPGRLDLLHVPDPALLGAALREDRPARADRAHVPRSGGAPRQSRPPDRSPGRGPSAGPRSNGWRRWRRRSARRSSMSARRWRTCSRRAGGMQTLDHPDRPGFKLLASPIRTGAEVPARPARSSAAHRRASRSLAAPAEIEELRAHGVTRAQRDAPGSSARNRWFVRQARHRETAQQPWRSRWPRAFSGLLEPFRRSQ